MASRGHRVIACAQRLLPSPAYDTSTEFHKDQGGYPTEDYCFVGLISLEDPPKHGVREAIGTLRLAGIKVMMVTGGFCVSRWCYVCMSASHSHTSSAFAQATIPRRQRQSHGRSTSSSARRESLSRRRPDAPSRRSTTTRSRLLSCMETISTTCKVGNGIIVCREIPIHTFATFS